MKLRRATLALASVLGLGAMTWATSVIPISIEELSRRASLIVEARAVNSWSEWNADHSMIFTFTRFAVSRSLKGNVAQEVVVRQMGGQVGHTVQRVSGLHSWLPGDESMLFLRPSDAGGGVMSVVGLMQGDFRITRSSNGEAFATNGVPQVKIFSPEAATTSAASAGGTEMRLEQLEARVRGAVK
jgi:hypothetical protein